jgi:hypothetical protein
MSRAANDWAWSLSIKPASLKLILLSMADRAGEDHSCYPSIQRLVNDTSLNRKTIISGIDTLCEMGFVFDTGERKGSTQRVKVYRLNLKQKEIENIECKQYQKRNGSDNGMVPILPCNSPENGTLNSPENGTQNQSLEPVIEPLNTLVSTSVETGVKIPIHKPDYIREIWNQYPSHRRGGTDQQLWKKWKAMRLTESDAGEVLSYLAKANQIWVTNDRFVPGLTKFIDEQRWRGPLPVIEKPNPNAPDWDNTNWADGFNLLEDRL